MGDSGKEPPAASPVCGATVCCMSEAAAAAPWGTALLTLCRQASHCASDQAKQACTWQGLLAQALLRCHPLASAGGLLADCSDKGHCLVALLACRAHTLVCRRSGRPQSRGSGGGQHRQLLLCRPAAQPQRL